MTPRIAISNIAWQTAEEPAMATLLQARGIAGVEVAPTKIWPSPLTASAAELAAYRRFWQHHGIEIVALQALLYGRPDLKLFASAANRRETLQYLRGTIAVAAQLGARILVFGAPKNRQYGPYCSEAEALEIACEFFGQLGETARERGCQACIEPNPPRYHCDFVTTVRQGLDLVARVDSPGFGLHLDAAALTLAGETPAAVLPDALPRTCHFHISEPQLGAVGEVTASTVPHGQLGQLLLANNYSGWRSIEMRAQDPADNRRWVVRALEVACRHYGAVDR